MKFVLPALIGIIVTASTVFGVYNYVPLDVLSVTGEERSLGSTITTIAGSDTLSSSRAVINTNFSNLNTDKFELSAWYATTSAPQITTLAGLTSASALATVGTITSGTWSGSTIAVNKGGTAVTSFGGSNFILYTTAADTLASEAAFTYNQTTNVLTATNGSFTNASSTGTFTLPVGASVITPLAGNIAIDTTSGQLRYSDVNGTVRVLSGNQYPAFTYASSTPWTGTTTVPLGTARVAETWNDVQCFTDAGTVQVSFSDGTNRMNFINASTTANTNTLSTNNTFTAGEKRYVDLGTPASSPTKISCTISKKIDAD